VITQTDRINAKVNAVFSIIAGVFFTLIVALVVFGQSAFSFAYPRASLLSNLALLPLLLAASFLFVWLRRRFAGRPSAPERWRRFLAVYFIALLALQTIVTRSLWFYPGWDVQSVREAALRLAQGEPVLNGEYFRMCPNNAFLTFLLAVPLWAAGRLGLAVPYAVLPYASTWLVSLSCIVCELCVCKLTQSRFARLGALLLMTVWIGFTLTNVVPYTDTFSILFPVTAFYVYLSRMRSFPKWLLITLLCFFGANVKPTVLIFEIALILLSAFRVFPLSAMTRKRWLRAGAVVLAIVLGAVPMRLLHDASIRYLAGSATPQEQLSETHYLMIGMNDDSYGGHSDEDLAFSTSFATLAERQAANLQVVLERVNARGFLGNVRFLAIKAYKAFSDGTLAAGHSYLILQRPVRTDAFSVTLRKFYQYNSRENILASTVQQGVWLVILLLCLAAFLRKSRRSRVTALLGFTLLGVGGYQLLFEVWPRYLFLYAPFFIITASIGLDGLRWPLRWKTVKAAAPVAKA